jgi:Amt family ammonium transporter
MADGPRPLRQIVAPADALSLDFFSSTGESIEALEWLDRKASLRGALENGAFCLLCQPIAPLTRGNAVYYEILLRMKEEESQLLPPGAFISAARECGLTVEMDQWVLTSLARWFRDGRAEAVRRPSKFAINVWTETLHDASFPYFVRHELGAHAFPPACLVFEIDQSDLLRHPGEVREFANAVTWLGCAVGIDGFAGPSSSLSDLDYMRIDRIKIDGALVHAAERDGSRLDALKAINDAAHERGIHTIAECIESPALLRLVRSIGIDYAQGFGVGVPKPLARLS